MNYIEQLRGGLTELRGYAQQRMESRVDIAAPTGERVKIPGGPLVDEYAQLHGDLPARLAGARNGQSQSRAVTVGGTEVTLSTRTLHLPHTIDDVPEGAVVHIVHGERAGTWWLVIEGDLADQQTAARLPVIATTKPEGWPT